MRSHFPVAGDPVTRLRLHLAYAWRHHRLLRLAAPTRFTELVQRRKLIDRDPRVPLLIDKVHAKAFVAEALGAGWVTPTFWSGTLLPSHAPWPIPFVVKSRHGCNQRAFVRTGAEDWGRIRRQAARWVRAPYGRWLDEWGYRGVTRGVIVEPFVGTGHALPVDYKLYLFHGRVACIQVHLDREQRHRWMLFDRQWHRLSADSGGDAPPPPPSLAAMIDGAEILGAGFEFVRIDFYDVAGRPRFGEMTFYPGSGLDRFDPPQLDVALGRLWLG